MNKSLLVIVFAGLFFTSCKTHKNIKAPKPKDTPKVVSVKTNPVKTVSNNTKSKTVFEYQTDYIERYKYIAMREMREYGIPASITLAQGILESGSGKSSLSRQSNNHFGIKCHKDWQGKSVNYDDDKPQECFRKYKNPEESFVDHSKFLVGKKRYAFLFDYPKDNYIKWAFGLKKAGYATDPKYPHKLIKYIERYNLDQYDELVLGKKKKHHKKEKNNIIVNEAPVKTAVVKPKKTTVITPRKEDPKVSETVSSAIENLTKDDETETTIENEPKVTKNESIHTVQAGETLYSISRKYAVTVADLKAYNNLETNDLAVGQTINLKPQVVENVLKEYTVVQGDTLYSISKKLAVSVAYLKEKNNLIDNNIALGQVLKY